MALGIALPIAATTGVAQQTPPPSNTPAATLPIGDWCYPGDETNIFRIQKNKTATNFKDKGTWLVAGKLLTISWENGKRLTIDITQTGDSIDGNWFTPKEAEPWKSKFKRATLTLPAERTLTDTQGRAMQVTVLSKSADGIKVRRTDGKEFEIALDQLSEADRIFVANSQVKRPFPTKFSKNGDPTIGVSKSEIFAHYGYHVILRSKGSIYAIETNVKDDKTVDRPFDNCAYAMSYTIRRSTKLGGFEKIKDGVAKDDVSPSNMLIFELCEFKYGAAGSISGYLEYIDSPEDMEVYGEQLATLDNFDTQIDPTKWLALTKKPKRN